MCDAVILWSWPDERKHNPVVLVKEKELCIGKWPVKQYYHWNLCEESRIIKTKKES